MYNLFENAVLSCLELVTTLSVSECRACRRFQHSWQRSGLLLWESVLFYCIVGALELLGWDCLLVAFRPELHRLWCILAGACCLAGPRLPGKSVLIMQTWQCSVQVDRSQDSRLKIVGILPWSAIKCVGERYADLEHSAEMCRHGQ